MHLYLTAENVCACHFANNLSADISSVLISVSEMTDSLSSNISISIYLFVKRHQTTIYLQNLLLQLMSPVLQRLVWLIDEQVDVTSCRRHALADAQLVETLEQLQQQQHVYVAMCCAMLQLNQEAELWLIKSTTPWSVVEQAAAWWGKHWSPFNGIDNSLMLSKLPLIFL